MLKLRGPIFCLLFPLLFTGLATLPIASVSAQSAKSMQKLIHRNIDFASAQYKLLAKNTPPDLMPRNYDPAIKKLTTNKTSWWTSGFFPGSLLYLYEYTKDSSLLEEAKRRLAILEPMKTLKQDHDLGFMMYCSFGNAYRITHNPAYKEVVMTSSETLLKRYRPTIHSIQSWDSSANFKCPVIIDNMMNLEMLCWASDEAREPKYKVVAIDHAETTIKNHYRPDYSSYHVVDYNLATGGVWQKKTAQGYSDSSAWARGQSWGLYGFTVMYRFTREPRYLDQARNIAKFILNNPHLPKDKIPYWDFDAPGEPHVLRDASAASILASALLELGQYTEGNERNEYVDVAKKIIVNLSKKKYKSKAGESEGFLLKHSVGAIPYKSEVDVSLTYADYYFIEAMMRYQWWYLDAQ